MTENTMNESVVDESPIDKVEKDVLSKLGEQLKSLYEKKNDDLEKKVYEVKVSKEGIEKLLNYFETEIEWEWSQSIGVVEICKALEKTDSKKPLFKGITIQAIAFHLSKWKGKGRKDAESFVELLLTPFNTAMGSINEDTQEIKNIAEKLNYMQMQMGAIEQGLDVERTSQMIEIEKLFQE